MLLYHERYLDLASSRGLQVKRIGRDEILTVQERRLEWGCSDSVLEMELWKVGEMSGGTLRFH